MSDAVVSIGFAIVIVACLVAIDLVVAWLVLSKLAVPAPRASWAVTHQGVTVFSEEVLRMQMDTDQKVSAALAILTAGGQPARVDAAPAWSVEATDIEVVTMEVAEDGLSATFTAVGVGTAQVTVTADADLGEGVRTITAIGAITVVPAGAAVLTLSFGEPEPK